MNARITLCIVLVLGGATLAPGARVVQGAASPDASSVRREWSTLDAEEHLLKKNVLSPCL